MRTEWPEPHSDNVCALEGRYFECASIQGTKYGQYTSPFLKDGPEQLALLLGLVWGCGFQILGTWRGVHPAAVAALPYRHATVQSGAFSRHVTLSLQGYGPPIQKRPLALKELREFAARYSELPKHGRTSLAKAMGNLRDSTERIKYKDKVVDVGAALSTIFSGDAEQDDLTALVPRRAAWYYSDSENERQEIENMLREFCACYLRVVRGRASDEEGEEGFDRKSNMLADADNVLRACLMSMIAEGQPNDWNDVMKRSVVRLDPPRAESEIPSVKADPLSWSVEEQGEIDRALEAVWRPIVEEAPLPPSHVGSTIASGVLSKLAEQYFEQGTPYVILHPARLYTAHPKWPQTASEPLDERARYYCERDVGRHLRLWTDAASSKGLVQFPVPNDANMYHPQYRDDWPTPLHSSHEEDSTDRIPCHPVATEEVVSSRGSKQSVNAEHQQHDTAVKQEPTDPPQQLPESVQAGLRFEWQRLWTAFQHDVIVATDSLLHLLDSIHTKHVAERQRLKEIVTARGGTIETLEDAVRAAGDDCPMLEYPKLHAFPKLTGEPMFVRTAPDGLMEQGVFKGWVSEVWHLWESSYRGQLTHDSRNVPDAIRPLQQVLGDLRHIRNNLLHNGVAKRGESASCEVLRWFREGERMQVRMRHVIDFLNQMGWLHEGSPLFISERGQSSTWKIDRQGGSDESAPALVSVRPFVDPLQQDPRYRYGVGVAFENGVFGTTPMGPKNEETETQAKERTQKWMKMTVNESGDLYVPDMGTISAAELYLDYLKEEVRVGPGIPGPWVQFRE